MSEFLATASVLIRPDTSKFRAELQAELAAATRGLVVPVPVASAVTGAGKVATRELTVATEQLKTASTDATVALQREGVAAAETAAVQRKAAVAAREHATAQEQLRRGAGATGLSLLNVRGATLAASGPFLAGAAAVTLFTKAIFGASENEEAFARLQRVLGPELAKTTEQWARMQTQLGLTDDEAVRAASTFAELLRNFGLTLPASQTLAQQLTELAPDMAAFANVPVADTLNALRLGVAGNLRGLRNYDIVLRQAEISQRALANSGKETATELTSQELAVARIQLIFEKAQDQVGAFEERSQSLAGQARILRANINELGDTFGAVFLPVMAEGAKAANDAVTSLTALVGVARQVIALPSRIPFFDRIKGAAGDFAGLSVAGVSLGDVLKNFVGPSGFLGATSAAAGLISDRFRDASDSSTDLADKLNLVHDSLIDLNAVVGGFVPNLDAVTQGTDAFANSIGTAATAAENASASIAASQDRLLDIEFRGGSSAQRIAELRRQIEEQQRIIGRPPTVAAKTRAKEERNRLQKEIDDILEADARARQQAIDKARRAAEKAKREAEKAAREAQAKLDAADQAFLDALGLRRGGASLRLIRAERTKGLQDDIAAQHAISALLRQAEVAARAQIHDVLLRAQTVQELATALAQSVSAEADLRAQQRKEAEEQAKAKRERAKLLTERAEQRADLAIEIADTKLQTAKLTENQTVIAAARKAEEDALKAKIKLDEQRLANVRGDLVRAAQLRLDIVRKRLALKELEKEVDKSNDAARSLAFSFLQAQQGFAANLLSNLVPVGAIRGTVGAGAGGQPSPALGPATALSTAGAVAGAGGGATRTQAAAMIDLLRGILVSLTGHTTVRQQPEAVMQMMWQSTEMAHL